MISSPNDPLIEARDIAIETAGNYEAYSLVEITFVNGNAIGTQTTGPWHAGTLGIIQTATTATNRKTRAVIRGLTRTKYDVSGLANGYSLQVDTNGWTIEIQSNIARRIAWVYSTTNNLIMMDGTSC